MCVCVCVCVCVHVSYSDDHHLDLDDIKIFVILIIRQLLSNMCFSTVEFIQVIDGNQKDFVFKLIALKVWRLPSDNFHHFSVQDSFSSPSALI